MVFIHILRRLFTEGIIPGVGSILSFIPTIALAVFILTFLRECSIIRGPAAHFIMGFSCSVPAILSCRSIENSRQRYLTMLLIPYMSCSAKLPIYVMLTSAFFPAYPYMVIGAVYAFGIVLVLLVSAVAKFSGIFCSADASSCKGQPVSSSAPSYRLRFPSMKIVFGEVTDCCIGFIKKAFTVILAASIIIWFLQNFDSKFHTATNIETSLLADLGRLAAPIFAPLGFGDWRAAAALITGLSAKEAVVSTFAVIAGASGGSPLWIVLEEVFSPLSAFCFMIFCLLYMPCIATLGAIRSISGKLWISLAVMAGQTVAAWLVCFLIFHSIKVII